MRRSGLERVVWLLGAGENGRERFEKQWNGSRLRSEATLVGEEGL